MGSYPKGVSVKEASFFFELPPILITLKLWKFENNSMNRFLTRLLTVIFINCHLISMAQVTPANRSVLNYRLIGFSVPEQEGVTEYEFEVSEFIITDTGTSIAKPVFTKKSNSNRLIGKVPDFGKTYVWKVNYHTKQGLSKTSDLYRFTTGENLFIDTSRYRLRVTHNLRKDNLYIYADGLRALFDMNGDPLWYLPDIPGIVDSGTTVRDLKVTSQGTITFITENGIHEIDYAGNLLWQGPDDGVVSGDKTERYHHEFTRLTNGKYMVCGNEIYWIALPDNAIDELQQYRRVKKMNGKYYTPTECGTIIEYDENKKVTWYWKSSEMFGNDYLLHANPPTDGTVDTRTHLNGFYFDEEKKNIYLSFRDISSIVKIAYPSGEKLAAYGRYGGQVSTSGLLFYGQHSCRINRNGELYFFNNNSVRNPDPEKVSSILVLKEPAKATEELQTIWKFTCDIDTVTRPVSGSGGNVYELNDGAIMASMGSVNRIFIVTKDKKIEWNAFVEARLVKEWQAISNYRASVIEDDNILNRLVYSPRLKKSIKKIDN